MLISFMSRLFVSHKKPNQENLRNTYPIQEVATLYGDYDIIVKVQMTKPDDLENFVFNGLRPISGIVGTETLIAARTLEFK